MAFQERHIHIGRTGNGRHRPIEEPPIGDLFRELSEEATTLVRQEIALGKAELRESARALGRDAAKFAAAAVLGWFGAMAAVAFLVLALGALIDSYWLSALIVAVLFLGAAAMLAKNARDELRRAELRPARTIDTIRADRDWAKQEMREFRREMRT